MEALRLAASLAADEAQATLERAQQNATKGIERARNAVTTVDLDSLSAACSIESAAAAARDAASTAASAAQSAHVAFSQNVASVALAASATVASATVGVASAAAAAPEASKPGNGSAAADGEGSEAESLSEQPPSSYLASLVGLGGGRASEKESLVPKSGSTSAAAEPSMRISMPGSFAELSSNAQALFGGGGGSASSKPPETALQRACACLPALTYQQRLVGFAICFFLGGLLTLSALSSLGSLLLGNAAPFAFKYTLGNLLSLGSSGFLVGPARQCRDMASAERRVASLAYAAALFGTLVSVLVLKIQLVVFACAIGQLCALTWYQLSYVPYGQQCLRRLVVRLVA